MFPSHISLLTLGLLASYLYSITFDYMKKKKKKKMKDFKITIHVDNMKCIISDIISLMK